MVTSDAAVRIDPAMKTHSTNPVNPCINHKGNLVLNQSKMPTSPLVTSVVKGMSLKYNQL